MKLEPGRGTGDVRHRPHYPVLATAHSEPQNASVWPTLPLGEPHISSKLSELGMEAESSLRQCPESAICDEAITSRKRTRPPCHNTPEDTEPGSLPAQASNEAEVLSPADSSSQGIKQPETDSSTSTMTFERCRAEAIQYNAMSKFQRWSRKAYKFAVQNDCLDDICAHLLVKGETNNSVELQNDPA